MEIGMFDVEVLIADSTPADGVADPVLQDHDQFQNNTCRSLHTRVMPYV
jgi:hypothetical protein